MEINVDGINNYNTELNSKTKNANSKNAYMKSLKTKFSDVKINMSNSFLFNSNNSTTLNFSPKYMEKALNDPSTAENIERLAGLAQSFPQYLNNHNTLPDGTKVEKVSFVVDENGGVSCNCEYTKNKDHKNKDSNSLTYLEQLRLKKEEELEKGKYRKSLDFYDNISSYNLSNEFKKSYNNITKI